MLEKNRAKLTPTFFVIHNNSTNIVLWHAKSILEVWLFTNSITLIHGTWLETIFIDFLQKFQNTCNSEHVITYNWTPIKKTRRREKNNTVWPRKYFVGPSLQENIIHVIQYSDFYPYSSFFFMLGFLNFEVLAGLKFLMNSYR